MPLQRSSTTPFVEIRKRIILIIHSSIFVVLWGSIVFHWEHCVQKHLRELLETFSSNKKFGKSLNRACARKLRFVHSLNIRLILRLEANSAYPAVSIVPQTKIHCDDVEVNPSQRQNLTLAISDQCLRLKITQVRFSTRTTIYKCCNNTVQTHHSDDRRNYWPLLVK